MLVGACSGESLRARRGGRCAPAIALGAMTFTGIFVPGLNTHTYLANPQLPRRDVLPDAAAQGGGRGDAVPAALLCRHSRAAAQRPHRRGSVHGDAAGRARDLRFRPDRRFPCRALAAIPVRIAHINPRLPRVAGPCRIPFATSPPMSKAIRICSRSPTRRTTPFRAPSASNIARFVPDGATIQTGLGKDPRRGAAGVARAAGLEDPFRPRSPRRSATSRTRARWRSGVAVTGGVAIGSQRLYGARRRRAPIASSRCPTPMRRACWRSWRSRSRSIPRWRSISSVRPMPRWARAA